MTMNPPKNANDLRSWHANLSEIFLKSVYQPSSKQTSAKVFKLSWRQMHAHQRLGVFTKYLCWETFTDCCNTTFYRQNTLMSPSQQCQDTEEWYLKNICGIYLTGQLTVFNYNISSLTAAVKAQLLLLLVCVSLTIIGQPRNSVLIRRV